jgi:hypothetical protein
MTKDASKPGSEEIVSLSSDELDANELDEVAGGAAPAESTTGSCELNM